MIPATVMKKMESYATEYAKKKGYKINSLQKSGKVAFADMFDFFAGTSTGSIITSALSYPSDNDATIPKYYMDDIIGIYKNQSKEIFQATDFSTPGGQMVGWVLFFIFWTGLFYLIGRYCYDWPSHNKEL